MGVRLKVGGNNMKKSEVYEFEGAKFVVKDEHKIYSCMDTKNNDCIAIKLTDADNCTDVCNKLCNIAGIDCIKLSKVFIKVEN